MKDRMKERRTAVRRVPDHRDGRDDEGSIPEWVMLLVMAVGIVLAIGAMVGPRLISIIESALGRLG